MTALAVRQNALDGAERQQQAAFWGVAGALHLGVPALFEAPNTNRYYVYSDSRITFEDLSWLGAFAANVASIPATWHVPIISSLRVDVPTLRTEARAFLSGFRVEPTGVEGETAQDVLDLQGAPGWMLAAESVPSSWTAVEA